MKKTLLLCIIAAMFLFSCKKEHSTSANPSGKKYKVTFDVANFSQSQKAFAVRRNAIGLASSDTLTALNSYFDVLYCFIYNQHDAFGPTIVTQDSTMSNMGTIADSLVAGNYEIIVIAGKKGLSYGGFISKPYDSYFGYGGKWQDAFFNSTSLTVTSGNISQKLTLKRVVGKLELQLLDNIPLTADSLSVTITPEITDKILSYGYSDAGSSGGIIKFSMPIPSAAKGHPNFVMDRIIGNTYSSFDVTITCKDGSNNVIATKTIGNLSCMPNTKTILSGKLFSGANTQNFTAQMDTTWTDNPNQYSW